MFPAVGRAWENLMPKLLEKWEVMPHGPLELIDDGILTVSGNITLPLGTIPRRMTAVALRSGGTAIYSAIALEEPEMARIEALGHPIWLVVPSDHHRMDARIWKQRYPDLRVVAPAGARSGVEEAVPVDSVTDPFQDPEVSFVTVAGTGSHEAALLVRRRSGTTLIVNDVIAHVARPLGLASAVMARVMGMGVSEPEVPRTIRHLVADDRPALATQFCDWASEPDLRRIIVSHGDVIEEDPAGVLRHLANEID